MPNRISESNLKPICSVKELAEDILGLSRQHFWNLQRSGVFPPPVYSIKNKRPYYPLSMQKICIEIRNSNIGYDNQPVLFYSPRKQAKPPRNPENKRINTPAQQDHVELVEGLKSMGLINVNIKDVETALKVVCPGGLNTTDQGVILRDLYRYLKEIP